MEETYDEVATRWHFTMELFLGQKINSVGLGLILEVDFGNICVERLVTTTQSRMAPNFNFTQEQLVEASKSL